MNSIDSSSTPRYFPSGNNYREDNASNDAMNTATRQKSSQAATPPQSENVPSTIVSLSPDATASASSRPVKVDSTDDSHAAYASYSLTINAPPDKVWQVLTEVKKWPEWVPGVSRVSPQEPIQAGSSFEWKNNGFPIVSTVRQAYAPNKLTWDGKALGTQAHHEWDLVSGGNNTTIVTTSESFDGWLPSLLSGTMQGTLDDSLPAWLSALKQRAET